MCGLVPNATRFRIFLAPTLNALNRVICSEIFKIEFRVRIWII